MNEEEAIEHSMISKSIGNAQKKIASKVNIEQSARSQKDWFQKNMPT
jgi:preprotein translocase subunit SecA